MECFAGVTTVVQSEAESPDAVSLPVVSWFPFVAFPSSPAAEAETEEQRFSAARDRVDEIAAGRATTEDRGFARPGPDGRIWMETDCDTDGRELEERWERLGRFPEGEDDIEEWLSEGALYVRAGAVFAACWRDTVGACFLYGSCLGADGAALDRSQWQIELCTDLSLVGQTFQTVWDSRVPGTLHQLSRAWAATR
eukprot:SRR837773.485.p1 GENE.SRR837773.485~~SRR837773.485.p1  ORF type:complete len:196 (-),score=27.22 SRR837773.485:177-764(-)